MKSNVIGLFAAAALAAAAGCAGYRWSPSVPQPLRTVAVPTFENRSDDAELGTVTTQYVLREFQREGTFKIRRTGDAAIEIQGEIVKTSRGGQSFDRRHGYRAADFSYNVEATVHFVNKRTGKVFLVRTYTAETHFIAHSDTLTGQRDAAPRIGHELARQIVDDAISYPYKDDDVGGAETEDER